jgi:hypothetical protein
MESTKIEGFRWVCVDCGKAIVSVSEAQQSFNVGVHRQICRKSAENLVKTVPVGNIHRNLNKLQEVKHD